MFKIIFNFTKNIINKTNIKNTIPTFEDGIDKRLQFIVEGIDLFHQKLEFFYIKFKWISIYFTKLYFYLVKYYPNSSITLWFIQNTKFGVLRVMGSDGGICAIRTFLWFRNDLIEINSYYLNYDGMDFKKMSAISSQISFDMTTRRGGYSSEYLLPASRVFDAVAYLPTDPADKWDLDKWDVDCYYAFFPVKQK